MPFVKEFNIRTGIEMWSDGRMVNAATDFCLCGKCFKHGPQGENCETYKRFIEVTTKELLIAAPVLGCVAFVEDPNKPNLLNKYFDSDKFKAGAL